ncbi:MAG: hypothetical protein GY700_13510 [Propionibacteriaceae bacterium]|nr:hypothetical protein [Propionibacteriaceae bacterium]
MSDTETPKEALERRIREAREKSAKFEQESNEKEQLRDLERKVKLEENKARDLPEIQNAEDEYGEIRVVNTPDGAIVVKRPNQFHFNTFSKKASSNKGLSENDTWKFVSKCVVYPSLERVEEIVEKYPGVTSRLGEKAVELGNGRVEEFEGK